MTQQPADDPHVLSLPDLPRRPAVPAVGNESQVGQPIRWSLPLRSELHLDGHRLSLAGRRGMPERAGRKGRQVLTLSDVREIRQHAKGRTDKAMVWPLAEQYRVSWRTVREIIRGQTWVGA